MREFIKVFLKVCGTCYGMKVREMPNGDTIECVACKGKGLV